MSSHAQHDSHGADSANADPVEAITSVVPIVLPIAGGVLIFLLAFIAVTMA